MKMAVLLPPFSREMSSHESSSAESRVTVASYWRKYVHEVLANRLGSLSLPRKSVVRLTDRPDMTLDVYRGRKTTTQHNIPLKVSPIHLESFPQVTILWKRQNNMLHILLRRFHIGGIKH